MDQLKKHLKKAWNNLSRLQVSGEAVDLVAAVRVDLRMAYSAAVTIEKKEAAKNAEGGNCPVRERASEDAADGV